MSAETDAWRLAEASRMVREFRDRLYSEEVLGVERAVIPDLAIFTLGGLMAVLHATDETVAKRMKEKDQG